MNRASFKKGGSLALPEVNGNMNKSTHGKMFGDLGNFSSVNSPRKGGKRSSIDKG
jgi:hypothetical protein